MNIRKWFVGGILLLAVIGVVTRLWVNPVGLLKQIMFIGIMVAAIYVIYRIWVGRKEGTDGKRSYAMAVKQSKKRTKKQQTASKFSSPPRQRPLRKKSTAHLTVIEGKKNKPKSKKKDRAVF
ncbi:SA1362 family protein [Lederbergia lenta]|uniref:SA1362 family protein n=1 Tax=Lederbergia lenta TaxID=1467 RepID=UPI00203E8582|nr:SA1362 family protein [Lederbergia lenta]MCM3111459.1 hypothetical protein [Lederbergia lenta]